MFKKFMKYLNKELPIGYYPKCSPKCNKVTIYNGNEYVYVFHRQEIEEDFELCCSLVETVVNIKEVV